MKIQLTSSCINALHLVCLCNNISIPTESMSCVPLLDYVIIKPSLDYETMQHMVLGGDFFDVLL